MAALAGIRLLNSAAAVSVRDVKVDVSTNRDIVLVATESGLYRSADEGQTYAAIPVFNGLSVWSIVRTSAGWLASAQPCAAAFVGLHAVRRPRSICPPTPVPLGYRSPTPECLHRQRSHDLGVGVPGDKVVYAYSSTVTDGR
jgi:hypothetical protein